ncbi:MAG: RNA-directed DNA polymerase [Jiangellaceae bacterium]
MTATHAIRTTDLVADLAEDLQTRWVPDVIADADLSEAVKTPRLQAQDVHFIEVPRVGSGYRSAPVLSGSALAALREAVQPLRQVSESILDPAVCGYRRGAEGSTTYSDEYRRFRSFADALSASISFVVIADVRNFFDSVDTLTLRRSFEDRLGGSWGALHNLLESLRSLGVKGLPAGYGDARLIANAVLAVVDEAIGVPFTRWVDDYRLFASSLSEADAAVDSLRESLSGIGLSLNEAKLVILDASDYRRQLHGVPLDSVYHPQDEPPDAVRASLRTVFTRAAADMDRRQLRFVLPRLAEQDDPIALTYALHALMKNSIEAPRLVHYVSRFLTLDEPATRVEEVARTASTSDWTLMRLVPLLYRIALSGRTLDVLAERTAQSHSELVRGALTRVLAIHGRDEVLRVAIESRSVADARAIMAACWDLNRSVPSWVTEAAPATTRALESIGRAPLPAVASLL